MLQGQLVRCREPMVIGCELCKPHLMEYCNLQVNQTHEAEPVINAEQDQVLGVFARFTLNDLANQRDPSLPLFNRGSYIFVANGERLNDAMYQARYFTVNNQVIQHAGINPFVYPAPRWPQDPFPILDCTFYRSIVGCVQRTKEPGKANCALYQTTIVDTQGNNHVVLCLRAIRAIFVDEELLMLGPPNYQINQQNDNVFYVTFQQKQQPWNPARMIHTVRNPPADPYLHRPMMTPLGQVYDLRWMPFFRKTRWV
jgi:hypothetical protein